MKKIGIICASDDELDPFLRHIENDTIARKSMLDFHIGKIDGTPVVALYSGVGKVNAAIATQILIDTYGAEIIINAGTAGGMDESVRLFDTVISTKIAYHDVADEILTEFHPWMSSIFFSADDNLLTVAKTICKKRDGVYTGLMVTGESFIENDMREAINKKFRPLTVDMETASIAHVCYVNKIPFIAVRTVTDTASHAGMENFEINCGKASKISKDVVLGFLKELSAGSL